MSDEQISPKIQKILDDIENKERTYDQLRNFYQNIHDSDVITEYERENLIEVVEKKIKVNFPAKAKKQFGSKDAEAVIVLQEIYAKLDAEFDLSNNEKNAVKSGVKVGGDMISGKKYVCRYFSFKTKQTKVNIGFAYNQDTVDGEPYYWIQERHVGQDVAPQEQNFKIHEQDQAIEAYKVYLRRNNVN